MHVEGPHLGGRAPVGHQVGQDPFAPPAHREFVAGEVAHLGDAHRGPGVGRRGDGQQREQDRREDQQHAQGGGQPRGAGEDADGELDAAGRLGESPVTRPLQGVIEARRVEGGQVHPRGRREQPPLGDAGDLGQEPVLGPARRQVQRHLHDYDGQDEQQRRQRGPHPGRRRAAVEQRGQDAGGGQQPERAQQPGDEIAGHRHGAVEVAGLPGQLAHPVHERRQPPGHAPEPAPRGQIGVMDLPGPVDQLVRPGHGHARRSGPGPTGPAPSSRRPPAPGRRARPGPCPR